MVVESKIVEVLIRTHVDDTEEVLTVASLGEVADKIAASSGFIINILVFLLKSESNS